MEPQLFGQTTGMSPLAIIVAAWILDLDMGRARASSFDAHHGLSGGFGAARRKV